MNDTPSDQIEHRIKEKIKSLPSASSREQQPRDANSERYERDPDVDSYPESDQHQYHSSAAGYQEPTLVLTPLENRSGGDMVFQDESYEPFRLEMTPPESMKRNNSSRFQESTPKPKTRFLTFISRYFVLEHLRNRESIALPASALKPTVLVSPDDTEDHNISEFESVCVDVVLKVDTLLSSATPNKTMGDRKDLLLLTQV